MNSRPRSRFGATRGEYTTQNKLTTSPVPFIEQRYLRSITPVASQITINSENSSAYLHTNLSNFLQPHLFWQVFFIVHLQTSANRKTLTQDISTSLFGILLI
uniref:Bm1269, isoform a n=1 Tax=Brugia malayi TaxID=6279 RepID=A0A1I9GF40_BRUMA|nr:Bm1269, isoform a [Brugia malayi]